MFRGECVRENTLNGTDTKLRMVIAVIVFSNFLQLHSMTTKEKDNFKDYDVILTLDTYCSYFQVTFHSRHGFGGNFYDEPF